MLCLVRICTCFSIVLMTISLALPLKAYAATQSQQPFVMTDPGSQLSAAMADDLKKKNESARLKGTNKQK